MPDAGLVPGGSIDLLPLPSMDIRLFFNPRGNREPTAREVGAMNSMSSDAPRPGASGADKGTGGSTASRAGLDDVEARVDRYLSGPGSRLPEADLLSTLLAAYRLMRAGRDRALADRDRLSRELDTALTRIEIMERNPTGNFCPPIAGEDTC